jgi:hypothetical protein
MIGVGFWPNSNWFNLVLVNTLPRPLISGRTRLTTKDAYSYKLPGAELTPLFGKWTWLHSSGSWRPGKTPATAGYIHSLELEANGTLLIWKNEELYGNGYFIAGEQNGRQGLWLKYSTRNKTNQRLFISFRLVGQNTLCLTEESRFGRKKHLFLRFNNP